MIGMIVLMAAAGVQDVAWKTSWTEALKEAGERKRLAVLLFFNRGLKDCVRFEAETLADGEVRAALAPFVLARIDPDGTDDDNKLWQDHKMPRPPMTYVYDPEGRRLTQVSSLNAKILAGVLRSAGPAYHDLIGPARAALKKDPSQAEAWARLGEAYARLENAEESASCYAEAVTAFGAKGATAEALKTLEVQLGRFYENKWYAQGRAGCRKVLELDPSDRTGLGARACWILGMADCAEGKWKDAIAGLSAACERYKTASNLDQMLFTLGSAYMYNREKDQALRVFGDLEKRFPGTESARIARVQMDKLEAR